MNTKRIIHHPQKGDKLSVEPIRKISDIKAISKMLADKPRDQLLFAMGVNNGLRTIDLLKLRVKDVRYLKPGAIVRIKESKTGKENVLMINKTIFKALKKYLVALDPDDEAYLFPSRKGGRPLQSQAVGTMIQNWTEAINLKGRYGAHTLRKTWGYIQRTQFGVGFEIICKRYNHSNPAITMRYLGVEDKEVHEVLMNEIG